MTTRRALAGRFLALVTLAGCASPHPTPTAARPSPPPTSITSPTPPHPSPVGAPQPSTGTGLLPPPPDDAVAREVAAPASAGPDGLDRSQPEEVAKAYAAVLFTVDWTRPLPTTQKLAAITPLAAPAVTAKLAHSRNYQPGPDDPRVAASRVDTVERVDLADADPVPGAHSYLATVHVTTRTAAAVTATEELLLVHVADGPGGWLVVATQLVS